MQLNKKIILFGGSFDPIHSGHLRVASYAMKALSAQKLIFVPANRSPHKTKSPTSGHHRYAMISKAIVGIDNFSVSDCELSRPEPSYTLDTIRFFREMFGPEVILHWLIGADQLTDLEKWYRINDLLKECHISVMVRAGYPLPDFSRFQKSFSYESIQQLEKDAIQTPQINISSTEIRHQLACGSICTDVLPPTVLEYILKNRLYSSAK